MQVLSTISLLLITTHPSQASTCQQGTASNSCNGFLNHCTSEGELCVLDSTTNTCCTASSSTTAVMRSASTCRSNMDSSVCSGVMSATTSPNFSEVHAGVTADGEECYNVEIGLILDEKPSEIAWEITSGRKSTVQQPSATVISTSPYYDTEMYQQASDTYLVCLPKGRYTFTMIDLGNDGMCCSYGDGRYALSYQPTGEIIARGSNFGSSESTTFKVPFEAPTLIDSDGDGIEDRTKNVIPTIPLTDDGEPSCSNEFGLHLVTDDYGIETTWELREVNDISTDYMDGKVVASGGPYTSDYTYDVNYCVNPGKYTFIFYDWQCDGLIGVKRDGYYTLKVNGMEVHTGGTNMTEYDEVVELNFVNSLKGYEEPEADASILDKYKVRDSSGVSHFSSLNGIICLASMVVAFCHFFM